MDADPTGSTPSTAAASHNASALADPGTAAIADRPDDTHTTGHARQPIQALRDRTGKLAEAHGASAPSAGQRPTPTTIRRGVAAVVATAAATAAA